MNGARPLVRFSGTVDCGLDASGPLGLTLVGRDEGSAPVQVSFRCRAPAGWPGTLESPAVARADSQTILVTSRASQLALEARSVFVHRDVMRAFERAVPPRRPPYRKRLFWRLVLALAGTRVGRRALTR